MPSFLGGKSRGAFGQPAFFCKLEKKYLTSINGKKKFKRILRCLFDRRRKVQVTKFAFEDHFFVFFTAESLSCSEAQPD